MTNPAVCLTFDFDAISTWVGTVGLTSPQYVSRGEFAATVATPRILDLLKREGVTCTWFIPGADAETFPEICQRIRDEGHEIGHHGYMHETPTGLTEAEEREMLERGLTALDKVLGVRPTGYRSPAADLSENSVRLLSEFGFAYDSSMFGSDFEPYWCRTDDTVYPDKAMDRGITTELVEVPIGTINDFTYLEFMMLPPVVMPANVNVEALGARWIEDLDYMVKEVPDGVFAPVFHPQAIGRGSRVLLLENLIHRAQEHNAEFTNLRTAVESWTARQSAPAVTHPK